MKVQIGKFSLNKIKKKIKEKNAVTMIELLIIIGIIIVLLIAMFMVYRTSIAKSRDAERKKDLKNFKIGMEDYYNDHESYPPESYFLDCDGDSLYPYVKKVPCDPTTGEPYLYLPQPGNGDNTQGYRILSRLDNSSDPIVEQIGCVLGCGIPEDHSEYGNTTDYIYGIAEGVPLVYGDGAIPTGTPTPTGSIEPTAIPTVDPSWCESNLCYCCSAQVVDEDCNVWDPNQGVCGIGPYSSTQQCYDATPCTPSN